MHFSLVSPRGHRRLRRDGHAGRAPRRLGAAGRLRQVAARHADGRGPPGPGRASSSTPARSCPAGSSSTTAPRRTSRSSTRSRPSAPARAGKMSREDARPHRARDLPRRGRVRRHVHRQHHGLRRRGAGHVPARLGRAAVGRPPPRRLRPQVRRGRGRPAAPGHHGPRHHDQGGVRERDRRRHGASAARPTPCCTCWRSPTRPRSTSTLDDFNRIGDRVPHLADLKPFGRYVMTDVDRDRRHAGRHEGAARRRPAARRLPHRHRQDGRREPRRRSTRRTSTARSCARWTTRSTRPAASPILHGSLAPEGAVVKTAGFDADVFEGTARVFDARAGGAWMRSTTARSRPGDVVVIRYEGPKGGPGMREMLAITGAIKGAGLGKDVAAAHRRPLLRRHHRPVHRPRRAGSRRRRPHRVRARRRPHPRRHRGPHRSTCWSTTPSSRPARSAGSRSRHATPGRAGQVRQARGLRRARRHHELTAPCSGSTTRWTGHPRCRAPCPRRSADTRHPAAARR